jgi:hypothetical protein
MTTKAIALLLLAAIGCGTAPRAMSPTSEAPVWTPDDGLICVNWDICPAGVVRWADQQQVPILATYCRAKFPGLLLSCGPCIDTRTAACGEYRGRCMAPNWPADATDYCGLDVAPPDGATHAWTLCTGADGGHGSDARTVCGEPQ